MFNPRLTLVWAAIVSAGGGTSDILVIPKRFLTSAKKNFPVKRMLNKAAVTYLKITGVNIKLKVMPRAAFFVDFTLSLNVHTVLRKRRLNSKL